MSAELNGRSYPTLTGCVHCSAPVHVTNYALGPEVEHYDPAAGFPTQQKGTAWRDCRNGTVATLPHPTEQATSTRRLCPTGQCDHGAALHDGDPRHDEPFICCVDDCPCDGSSAAPSTRPDGEGL